MTCDVSVVLSTYNALDRLKNCLYSLTLQKYPLSSIEVVVIDDGSTDGTEEYMKNTSFPFPVIYEKNDSNLGRSHTRNKGIRLSSGRILIFSDCDMILPPEFIQSHLNYHKQSDNLVVCGSFWNQIPFKDPLSLESIRNETYLVNAYEQPWAYWFKQFVNYYGKHLKAFYFPWMYFVVMNVSVNKQHVVNAGSFDEGFIGYGGEDEELGYRLYKSGLHFIVDSALKNFHQEHLRSLNESNESQSNIQYILNKHRSMDTLLFYQFNEFHHFFKSDVLKELDGMFQTYPDKRNEFEDTLLRLSNHGTRQEWIDFYQFTRSYPCSLLSKMLLKNIKQKRRF